ncbi:MAG: hypothetical protein C4331_08345 [Meiothermus sp.]
MLDSEFEKTRIYAEAKTRALLAEAEVARALPKRTLRHHIAEGLRAWAERLEPSVPPVPRVNKRLSRA